MDREAALLRGEATKLTPEERREAEERKRAIEIALRMDARKRKHKKQQEGEWEECPLPTCPFILDSSLYPLDLRYVFSLSAFRDLPGQSAHARTPADHVTTLPVDLLAPNLNHEKAAYKQMMERESLRQKSQAIKDRDRNALEKQKGDAVKSKADKKKKAEKQERRA